MMHAENSERRRRILFVDDEPHILDSLRDGLRRKRKSWDMVFESSPSRALSLLDEQSFDVVVSDMRMPEIDGATLLSAVRERHPAAVRIVLSGFTELEVAIRAVTVAHQFLTKPCQGTELEEVINRSCQMQEVLTGEALRDAIGKLDSLPPTPRVYATVTEALTKTSTTADTVARIIELDPGMSAKLLQMSNSGFFRLARPISRVEDAVAYLGFNMVKNLVLSTEVFSTKLKGRNKKALLSEVQEHSRCTARIAINAPGLSKPEREDAFLAALLHDVGKIVLATQHPDYPEAVSEIVKSEGVTWLEAETRLFDVSHAEVGAYLLGLWGVPFTVVEAVAFHHKMDLVAANKLDPRGAVALADAVVHEVAREMDGSAVEGVALSVGELQNLSHWRVQAENAVAAKSA